MTPNDMMKEIITMTKMILEENHDYYNFNINQGLREQIRQASALLEEMENYDKVMWDGKA